jgi:hypothetical protein
MVFTKAGLVNEAEIEAGVRKVEREFAPEVVRIGYSFRDNWMGDPAVYFRILVTDEAAAVDRLMDISRRISVALMDQARVYENGLEPYFSYRSISSQRLLKDPVWDM